MKKIVLLCFFTCYFIISHAQIILNGTVVTDEGIPVPDIKLIIAGESCQNIDSKGQFSLKLSKNAKEGEAVLIKILKKGWTVKDPKDGVWNLPNINLQNIQLLKIVIVPSGSKLFWSHSRIETFISNILIYKDKLQIEDDKISTFIASSIEGKANELGISKQRLKTILDEWANNENEADELRIKGLKSWYNNNINDALCYFKKSALLLDSLFVLENELYTNFLNPIRIKTFKQYMDLGTLTKGKESIEYFQNAKKYITADKFPREWFDVQLAINFRRAAMIIDSLKYRTFININKDYMNNIRFMNFSNILLTGSRFSTELNNENVVNDLSLIINNVYSLDFNIQTTDDSLYYGMTQGVIGLILNTMGKISPENKKESLLNSSIEHCNNALKIFKDLHYTQGKINVAEILGESYSLLGSLKSNSDRKQYFNASLSAYIESMEGLTEIYDSIQDGILGMKVGALELDRCINENDSIDIELVKLAIGSFHKSLKYLQEDKNNQSFLARTKMFLGIAYELWSQKLKGEEKNNKLNLAIESYSQSLNTYTKENFSEAWAYISSRIGYSFDSFDYSIMNYNEIVSTRSQSIDKWNDALIIYNKLSNLNQCYFINISMAVASQQLAMMLNKNERIKYLDISINSFNYAIANYSLAKKIEDNVIGLKANLAYSLIKKAENSLFIKEKMRLINTALDVTSSCDNLRKDNDNLNEWYMLMNVKAEILFFQSTLLSGKERKIVLTNLENIYLDNIKVNTNDFNSVNALCRLYEEIILNSKKALKMIENWKEHTQKDLFNQYLYAEVLFTNGRYNECKQQIENLRFRFCDNPFLMIGIDALAIGNKIGMKDYSKMDIENDISQLQNKVSLQSDPFNLNWDFNGIQHYIKSNRRFRKEKERLIPIYQALAMDGNKNRIIDTLEKVKNEWSK